MSEQTTFPSSQLCIKIHSSSIGIKCFWGHCWPWPLTPPYLPHAKWTYMSRCRSLGEVSLRRCAHDNLKTRWLLLTAPWQHPPDDLSPSGEVVLHHQPPHPHSVWVILQSLMFRTETHCGNFCPVALSHTVWTAWISSQWQSENKENPTGSQVCKQQWWIKPYKVQTFNFTSCLSDGAVTPPLTRGSRPLLLRNKECEQTTSELLLSRGTMQVWLLSTVFANQPISHLVSGSRGKSEEKKHNMAQTKQHLPLFNQHMVVYQWCVQVPPAESHLKESLQFLFHF